MASIIPGFEYDIFISYRQKDNKYDGWVIEFVDNLKRELEATFKEDISVYFDINAHDGLLETHDVNATIKNKLKCLVCIPVISRTYCDPKSFAWEHEFKPFVEQASNDEFGMKVRLPNGNIANRVLPVRIHELDISDIKLFESVVGTTLRPIDFVYKETGVNRQLRAKDDEFIKHSNQVLYRDQINKVALALKDIIERMQPQIAEIQQKDSKISGKHDNKSASEEITGIGSKVGTKLRFSGRKLVIPAIIFLVATGSLISILNHKSKVRWAKEKALSEINKLELNENYAEAFRVALKCEKYISKEPELKDISRYISKISFNTDPSGADVYIREYSDINKDWVKIGTTPIDSFKLPQRTYYLAKIEKKGYESILATFFSFQSKLKRKLFSKGSTPGGMVHVEGFYSRSEKISYPDQDYYIDRYEVTNEQYKEFVESGGYDNNKLWKNEFVKDGKVISWSDAMKDFVDKTGRPGPATWAAGDYPENEETFPVSGISWYEAAAFAEYAGKSLPTVHHWSNAAWSNNYFLFNFCSRIAPLSNFNGKGPEATGKNQGINCFGAYDMAGNVREWCWNETNKGRVICGGAWDNVNYMYSQWSQLSPFDRSSRNGFRCVRYISQDKIPEIAFRKVKINYDRDFTKEKPVSDDVFRIYKNQFQYDKADLESRIEKRDTIFKDWSIEKISYNAAYGDERVVAYLFLPKNSLPPFQTMIYFPGTDVVSQRDLIKYPPTFSHVDFLLKNGRAVLYPVYKGTFERQAGLDPLMTECNPTHEYTDWLITWVKDFKRSVDYLETRSDIDTSKLGYFGVSWGGMLGGIIPAVENRLKVSILYSGGFDLVMGSGLPEADAINYVPRIKIPVLMLNGKYDSFFPYETTVVPFFDLLGTPATDKKTLLYDTDHDVPPSEMIKETLNWLDKYFGPAK